MKTKHVFASLILLMIAFSGFFGIATAADAQEVHALLICLGDDLNIRASVNVNEEKMTELLGQVSKKCDVDLTIMKSVKARRGIVTKMTLSNATTISVSDQEQGLITTKQVIDWLENLRPKAEDTVFVYYNGHGKAYGKTHMLHFDDGTNDLYNRDELRALLSEKQARLKLLITDTCKNQVSTPIPRSTVYATVREKNRSYTEHLFLQHRGLLDITAASTNQFALANDLLGGFFTAALIESFSEKSDMKREGGIGNSDGFLSWDEVFAKCVWETQDLFSQSSPKFDTLLSSTLDENNQMTQTPEQFSLPTPIRRGSSPGPSQPPVITPSTIGQNGADFDDTILQGHTEAIHSVSFSPDGHTIASGGGDYSPDMDGDYTIRLWEVSTGRLIRTLTGHTDRVESVSFSPDGHTIASNSWDDTIRLWEVSTGKLIRILTANTTANVSFSPDGHTIASCVHTDTPGSEGNTIRLWEVSTGKLIRTLRIPEHYMNYTWGVSFSPDGHTIASGGRSKTIRLWEVSTGKLIQTLTGHTEAIHSVSFSPDGHTIASWSSDNTIRLWEVSTGKLIRTLTPRTHRSVKNVLSVSFSPDGHTIASGHLDNTIRLWEVSTGKLIQTLTGHTNSVDSVSFSPDGHTIASGSRDDTVRLWKLAD